MLRVLASLFGITLGGSGGTVSGVIVEVETAEVESHGASFITISVDHYIKFGAKGGENLTVEAKVGLSSL